MIASNLWAHVVDLEQFQRTATLTQHFSLRSAEARKAFSWCSETPKNRYFTERALSEAVKLLFERESLKLPEVPGLTFNGWLKSETKKLVDLCKRARRTTVAAMDPAALETQAWHVDEACFSHQHVSHVLLCVYKCICMYFLIFVIAGHAGRLQGRRRAALVERA